MGSQPVFGAEDRVRPNTELPAEIRNERDPVKIAHYYQQREARLRDELRTQQAGREATPRQSGEPPPRTASTFEQRTDDQTRRPLQMTEAEATSARNTLIHTARTQAAQGRKYWARLERDIETVMTNQPPENQIDVGVWTTAYNSLVGFNLDRLLREDAEAATAAEQARITSERSAAPAGQEPAPPPLPVEVGKVLRGLNITESQYRTAQDNIANGKWPLTADNTGGRRVLIGGGER